MKNLILILILILFCGWQARAAVVLQFLAKTSLPSDFKFKKTRVGGISGLVYEPERKIWIAVSDDRGRVQEPRFYEFDFKVSGKNGDWKLEAVPKDVFFLHPKDEKRWKKNVLDLEGVTLLPWGNYLISSEGDNNQKPRVMPTLLDVKPNGTWVRDFSLPEECLPESAGQQAKGIQNNRGPEGLTSSEDSRRIFVAIESPLLQDRATHANQIRIIQYEMPEAWIIKPTAHFFYPVEAAAPEAILSERGVSDLFWLKEGELLVMERALEVSTKSFGYDVKLFQTKLGEPGSVLKKEQVLDFKIVHERVSNFEALAWGPALSDGRKTLLVASDNNFQKGESTEFWLFAFEAEKK